MEPVVTTDSKPNPLHCTGLPFLWKAERNKTWLTFPPPHYNKTGLYLCDCGCNQETLFYSESTGPLSWKMDLRIWLKLSCIICSFPTFLYYRLVLQAADRGNPPLSSTATVRVQVVDVNDNSPAIPPMDPVLITESKPNSCQCTALPFLWMAESLQYINTYSFCRTRFKSKFIVV